MPPQSVLAFIVPKLVLQAENAVSDCLQFILSNYPRAADSLVAYLARTGVALPAPLEFTTQIMWEHGGGRPDMLGTHGERPLLVVEAKFDAPLTMSQPVDYVRCLPTDASGILLFLAPAVRIEEMWETLEKRCTAARIPLGPRSECANGLVAATLHGNHRLAIASWESLMSTLLDALSPVSEPEAHADVSQLRALCARLLSGEIADRGFAGDPDRNERDQQMRRAVDSVVTNLMEAGHANTKGYRPTPGPGYYKRYMTLHGRKNWCVEFNSEYWARFGESQIWLSSNRQWLSDADCAALETKFAPSIRRIRQEVLIPLLMRHACSRQEALEQMTTQAADVATLLAATPASTAERGES